MTIDHQYQISKIAGESVIFTHDSHGTNMTQVISLNETSEWLWNTLYDQEFTVESVIALLLDRFEVDRETAQKDAESWIHTLVEYHLAH